MGSALLFSINLIMVCSFCLYYTFSGGLFGVVLLKVLESNQIQAVQHRYQRRQDQERYRMTDLRPRMLQNSVVRAFSPLLPIALAPWGFAPG